MAEASSLERSFREMKKEGRISTPNPWLDPKFNRIDVLAKEPGLLGIDDIPERLGLIQKGERLQLLSSSFVDLGDTPSDYGKKGQFVSTDGVGKLTFDWPYWIKTGSNIYYKKGKVGVGISGPLAQFHTYGDTILDGAVTINESGSDKDCRIEGDTEENLLFCDASTDRVAIGLNAPLCRFHVRGVVCADYAGLNPDTILLIENDDNVVLQMQAATNGEARIVFADDAYNPPAGGITYDYSDDEMDFVVGTNVLLKAEAVDWLISYSKGIKNDSPSYARFTADSHDADAFLALEEDTVRKWTVGFDYSDSLKFKICEGIMGTNDRIEIEPGGPINIYLPLGLREGNELRFYDNGNYVGFEAPALSADQIWVLPSADGPANEVIGTDNSGNLIWRSFSEIAGYVANTDEKVKVDSGATAGYLGVAFGDGVLRVTENELTVTDGGDFITLGLADHATARTALGLAIGSDVQAYHASLASISGLSYVSGSFISLTGADTYAVRTYAEVRTDLGLVIGTDVQAYDATIVVDADFGSAGLCATDGAGTYSIVADASANWNTAFGWGDHSGGGYATSGGAEHDSFSDFVANEHINWEDTASASDNLGTSGFIALHSSAELRFYDNGNYVGFEAPALGADQIWVLPAVDGNANEVLKTDGGGNLGWVAMAGGGDVTAGAVMTDHSIIRGDGGAKGVQDSGIIIDDSDNVSGMGTLACGVITVAGGTSTEWNTGYDHSQIAGGNSVHVSVAENTAWDAASAHVSASGSSHSYLNQSVTSAATPTFAGLTMTGGITKSGNLTITASGRLVFVCSTGFQCQYIYSNTTTASGDVRVTTSGYLKRYSSSIKYKNKVEDLELDSALIYNLRPVSFCSTSEDDDKKQRFHGFIAEEIERVCPELVSYGINNEAEGYSSDALGAMMLAEIQRHEARIKELEARLNN